MKKNFDLKRFNENIERLLVIADGMPEKHKTDEATAALYRNSLSYEDRGFVSARYIVATENASLMPLSTFAHQLITGVFRLKRDERRLVGEYEKILSGYIDSHMYAEYHHCGKKGEKEFFLTKEQVRYIATNVWKIICEHENKADRKRFASFVEMKMREAGLAYLKQYGTRFERVKEVVKNSVCISKEMYGKYGWFEASGTYNLPIYYSGYTLQEEKVNEFVSKFGQWFDVV